MPLNPKISISTNNKCNKVNLTEKTGIYVTTNNIGGWGTPNIDTDTIVIASVKIYGLDSTLLTTFVLKDTSVDYYSPAITSPIPSEFAILINQSWSQLDGIFKVVYSVDDGTNIYTNDTQYELFLCNLCNCKNSLVLKVIKECDSTKLKSLNEYLDQIEVFIYGIQTAFACGNFSQATSILTNATLYCKTVSDCNCGNHSNSGCGCSDH